MATAANDAGTAGAADRAVEALARVLRPFGDRQADEVSLPVRLPIQPRSPMIRYSRASEPPRQCQDMPEETPTSSSGSQFEKITPLTAKDVYGNGDVIGRVLESLLTRDPVTMAWEPLGGQIAAEDQRRRPHLHVPTPQRRGLFRRRAAHCRRCDLHLQLDHEPTGGKAQPRQRAYYSKIKSVVAPDHYTVVFTFAEPYFKSEELAGLMAIMPAHFYSKYTPEQFNKAPACCWAAALTGWKIRPAGRRGSSCSSFATETIGASPRRSTKRSSTRRTARTSPS